MRKKVFRFRKVVQLEGPSRFHSNCGRKKKEFPFYSRIKRNRLVATIVIDYPGNCYSPSSADAVGINMKDKGAGNTLCSCSVKWIDSSKSWSKRRN